MHDDLERSDAVALATAPALPCLKSDNCIRSQRRKQLFVAQENIRCYIDKFGIDNVGLLTITVPGECLSSREFQARWHSFRTNVLVRLFPTGMWVRERQARTGNFHAHAVVNLGRDVRTSFPFEQVQQGFYANVDSKLRTLWRELRERAVGYGFGRTELLPVKHTSKGCARYLTKYLGKAFVTEKCIGEEKCRLFGVWGGVRFVHGRFDWVSSRMLRRRKQWLAETHELRDVQGFQSLYGTRWWFVIGEALMKVILPIRFYQVFRNRSFEWDDVGWFAYQQDLGRYSDLDSDEARRRQSLFDFYCVEGAAFDMSPGQAARYAMGRIGYLERAGRDLDPQVYLRFESPNGRVNRD